MRRFLLALALLAAFVPAVDAKPVGYGAKGGGVDAVVPGSDVTVDSTNRRPPVIGLARTTTKTTLVATNAVLTVAGLNGDVDGQYDISGELFINVNNSQIQWLPNGVGSNLLATSADIVSGAASDATMGTLWILARNSGVMNFQSGQKIYFEGKLFARSGRVRHFTINVMATGGTNAFASGFSRDQFTLRGVLTDTSTNITSLTIGSGQVNGLGIGSFMRLTRTLVAD